jgi:hypothetical protein
MSMIISLQLSSQTSLSKERPGLFRKLFVKSPSASSAGQYPDTAPMASSSSAPDPIYAHPNEVGLACTVFGELR